MNDNGPLSQRRELSGVQTNLTTKKLPSKSPTSRTFKQLRNISPIRTQGQNLSSDRSHYNTAQKYEQLVVALLNKNFDNPEDYKELMLKIFRFYISFGERNASEGMKANQLFKFAFDANLIDQKTVTQINLDLLFRKHSSKSTMIDFEKFLLLCIDLAVLKFPNSTQKQAFSQLFLGFMKPLCLSLYRETNLVECETIYQESIEPGTTMILREVIPILVKIHRHFFANEYKNFDPKTARAKSELLIPRFIKEYDICPSLLNWNVGYNLFQEVTGLNQNYLTKHFTFPKLLEKDQGTVFTVKRFLVYLIRAALIGYSSLDETKLEQKLTQQEKLTLFLEKMEFSKGFTEFKKSTGASNLLNTSILPQTSVLKQSPTKNRTMVYQSFMNEFLDNYPKNVLESFVDNHSFDNNSQSSIQPSARNPRGISPLLGPAYTAYHNRGLESESSPTRGRSLDLKESTQKIFNENLENLKEIFVGHCSLMSSGKEGYVMRATDLANLLRDVGLLEVEQTRSRSPSKTTSPQPSNRGGRVLMKRLELDLYLRKILVTRNQTTPTRSKSQKFLLLEDSVTNFGDSPQRSKSPSVTQRKITFEVFLKVIEHVAILVNPKVKEEEAVKHVIGYYLEPILNGGKVSLSGNDVREQFKILIKMLKDPALVDVLAFLKKQLHVVFKRYCLPQNTQINFAGFMKFCRDFAVFPNLMSRNKLMKMFYSLASLYPLINKPKGGQNTNRGNDETNGMISQKGAKLDVIDENLFVQSIATCASERIINEEHMVSKVYRLLEKMKEGLIPRQIGAIHSIALE